MSPYSEIFGGAVLNATINMYAYACIEPCAGNELIVNSWDRSIFKRFPLDEKLGSGGDLALPLAVYSELMEKYNDGKYIPLTLSTSSDAPAGSGLGASSALVVAAIGAFAEYLRLPLGEYEIARLAFDIERVRVAMAGGKQDQYAATFGGFNFMEFQPPDKVIVNPLRIKKEYVNELQYNMLLYYTGTSRLSSEIILHQSANVQAKNEHAIEAMHRLKEQAIMMKEALLQGEVDRIGAIFDFGWINKKQMADRISNPCIDEIYETARKNGAMGGKLTGAGGGGFFMLYCDGDRRWEVARALERYGGKTFPFEFSMLGLETWKSCR